MFFYHNLDFCYLYYFTYYSAYEYKFFTFIYEITDMIYYLKKSNTAI